MKQSKKSAPETGPKPTRRQFLAASGAALAGAASASRLSAASYSRVLGANDRINIGVIGTGGMGTAHVGHVMRGDQALGKLANADISAVCDVYDKRRDYAAELGGAKGFRDHRELLARNASTRSLSPVLSTGTTVIPWTPFTRARTSTCKSP